MTTPVVDPIDQYEATGLDVTFDYTWILNDENDIVVLKNSAGVITTLDIGIDYTVEDVGEENGGTITPIGSQIPTTNGDIWTLYRDTSIKRTTDFNKSGAFFAETINAQLDYLTEITQDINRRNVQSLRIDPALNQSLDPLLPELVDRRCPVFVNTGGDNFELVMSLTDPDDKAEGGGSVISVNGKVGVVVLDTDDIGEGLLNLYYKESRVDNNSSVVANTAKVSADGSINTHSDVDTTTDAPDLDDVLTWDNSNWVPKPPPQPNAFRGALVYKSAPQTISDNTPTVLDWDLEDYDTDNIHDNVTNNNRLTVPAGVTRVRLACQLFWATDAVPGSIRNQRVQKNGTTFIGMGEVETGSRELVNVVHSLTSAIVSVVGGDYFDFIAYQNTGANLDVEANDSTWAAMEIIE